MNWTGGRLQRSKANAKGLLKTQKQHFTKARLPLQNGGASQPLFDFSISHRNRDYDAEMEEVFPICNHHRCRKRSLSQDTSHDEHPSCLGSPSSRHHNQNTTDKPQPKRRRSEKSLNGRDGDLTPTATANHQHKQNVVRETNRSLTSVIGHNRKSAAAEENTLQSVKRNLLENSDWMGLSAARPLKISFSPAEEKEKIGKRRTTKRVDEQRAVRAQTASSFHTATHCHHRAGQRIRHTSTPQTDDASNRVGNNIHQPRTMTWLSSKGRPATITSQTASTESMLLDRADSGTLLLGRTGTARKALRRLDGQQSLCLKRAAPQGGNQPVFCEWDRVSNFEDSRISSHGAHASSANAPSEIAIRRALPTLDQLRDSKNFDELKTRFASRSSKGSKISPPPPLSPMAKKEGTEDGCYVDDSSSLPNSQRILPTYDYLAESVAGDTFETQKLVHCKIAGERHVMRAEPSNLPNGLWPNHASQLMSHGKVDMPDGTYPSDPRRKASSPKGRVNAGERAMVDDATAAGLRYQRNLAEVPSPRPVFTLEHQVSNEAMVKRQQDSQQNTPFGLRKTTDRSMATSSETKSDRSRTVSYARARQNGDASHCVGSPSSRSGDLVTSEGPPGYAAGSMIANVGGSSSKDRSLDLLNGSMQTPPRIVSELTLQSNVRPRLLRAVVLQGLRRREPLQKDHSYSDRAWSRSSWSGAGNDQRGERDEEQMESVISGSDGLRGAFDFKLISPKPRFDTKVASLQKPIETEESIGFNHLACRPQARQPVHNLSPAKSSRTFADAVLGGPKELLMAEPSEIDFLSQMGPMEGRPDERPGDTLVYNAARSVRSFIVEPSLQMPPPQSSHNKEDVAWAHSSGSDITPSGRAIGAVFSGLRDIYTGTEKPTVSGHERLPDFRSTHRQLLQAGNTMSIVSTQPFAWTPQVKSRAAPTLRKTPRPISTRSSSSWPYLSSGTRHGTRPFRTSRETMGYGPVKLTPVQGKSQDSASTCSKTTTSSYLKPHQTYSIQRAHGALFANAQCGQATENSPQEHESAFLEGQTPIAPGACGIDLFDEYPFADKDALEILSTDSSATYSGFPDPVSAIARPGSIVHNIYAMDQPFTFEKPRPFVGIYGTVRRPD